MRYRGRFAPTPSGPLHLGSLLTALASYLQARARGGQWLIRIDDLDGPRCLPGMDTEIFHQLEAHGLHWDESPRYQSGHVGEYREALAQLEKAGLIYRCTCTRATLSADSREGPDGPVYSGHCRSLDRQAARAAIRLRVPEQTLCFNDGWQGKQCRRLAQEVGDFVVKRSDGQFAYQFACAVDEAAQNITEVVRGADLLGSTFMQLRVQEALGLPVAAYRHLPVLTDRAGRKLSKQNHAASISQSAPVQNLQRGLAHLGQDPPAEPGTDVAQLLGWAVTHWRPEAVPRTTQLLHLGC